MQYEKLLETLNVLKGMIENTLVSIGADEEILNKIRNSALTEENMIEFIAILEEKGLNIIGEYSRLLAEVTINNSFDRLANEIR
jgi:coiled-coil domain-containing protein 63/114